MRTFLQPWMVLSLGLLAGAMPQDSGAALPAVEAGDILVANYREGDNTVLRINPVTGVQHRLGGFITPTDLILLPGGQLYVSEWNGAIKRLNLIDGSITLVNSNSTLSQVWGLALGPAGDLFVTSGSGYRVVRLNPATGAETLVTQSNLLSLPVGIDFLDPDHAVVASMLNSRVISVRLSDQTQTVIAPNAHAFNDPWGIAVHGTNIYVGAHDSKMLQRISGTNVTAITQLAGAPFGIGVATNGEIVVGVSGGLTGPFAVVRVSPDGQTLANYSGGLIGEVTGVEIAQASVLAAEQANTPPTLEIATDQNVYEEDLVSFIATAGDTNWPLQNLTFSLEPGAPDGASITPGGVFTWSPSELQGPGVYPITVKVTDDGVPPLFTTNTFIVTVNELNVAPEIAVITNRTVVAETPIAFAASATDPDLPAQTLTFSLGAGAPDGAAITSGGQFTWTPSDLQAPGTYPIRVVVTDNATPPLYATNTFAVVVNQRNVPPVVNPIPEKTVNESSLLSFNITAVDSNQPPQSLSFYLETPAPAGTALTLAGRFTWTPTEEQGAGTYDLRVRVTDNGTPPMSATNTFRVIVNESNRPPVLAPIASTNIMEGATVTFTAQATDPDLPAQGLAFSLAANAPTGAVVSPQGVFTWTPDSSQAPSSNFISIRVTDDGSPPLSATQSFTMIVRAQLVVEIGDILVADNGGGAVYKVNPQTGGTVLLGSFDSPTDVAISHGGDIYVSEWGGSIKRLDLNTGTITVVNPGTNFSGVWGLAIGRSGDLYVTSSGDHRVVGINPQTGTETLVAQDGLLVGPYGIDVLDAGHLVVSSLDNGQIVKIALAGGAQSLLPTVVEILNPWGAAVRGTNIYVAGLDLQAVEKISGNTASILSYTDGTPYGIGADTNGDVFVGVSGAVTSLARIHPDGTSSTLALDGLVGPITGVEVSPVRINAPQPTNSPPVPSSPTLARYPAGGVKVRSSLLLGMDPDGDTLFLSAVDPASTLGGTVSTNAEWVIYTPPAGVSSQDSFGYIVGDSRGGFGAGVVTVVVTTNAGPSLNLTWADLPGGQVRLRGSGIPQRSYLIEYTESLLTTPVWHYLGAVETDALGLFAYLDQPPANAPSRYYRAICP